jgi:hypothetical protein
MWAETPLGPVGPGEPHTQQDFITRIDNLLASTPDIPNGVSAPSTPSAQYNTNIPQAYHQPVQPHYYAQYPPGYPPQPTQPFAQSSPITSMPITPTANANTNVNANADVTVSTNNSKRGRGQKAGDVPKKKSAGGRPAGTQNWTTEDVNALVKIVKSVYPIGMNGWKTVSARYTKYAVRNDRKARDYDAVRDKWKKVSLTPHKEK